MPQFARGSAFYVRPLDIMKVARFIICLSLAAFVCGFGCTSSKPTPDPLAGFHWSSLVNLDNNKTITDDYKSYIQDQKLPPGSGSEYVAGILYFEDGTGQHAVQITISLNHAVWEHVLIYDKSDKRIKAIKYAAGHVSC
jgi:hypothetical protein